MTQKEHIYAVRTIVGKLDRKEFHPEQVKSILNKAYNQILGTVQGDELADFIIATKEYDVTVDHDTVHDEYYISLPVQVVPLPDKTKGVIHVNTLKGSDMNFYPMTEMDVELLGGSFANDYITKIGYYPRREKVKFYNMDSSITKVRVTLAPQFSDFDPDDEIPIPRDYDISQMAVEMLRQTSPIDLYNNG